MVSVLAINHNYGRSRRTRRRREVGMRLWNLRHYVLPGIFGAAAASAFAAEQAQPWTVTIVDADKHRVEVSRGNHTSIFHYGRSSSGEMYFCAPGGTQWSPVRAFDPEDPRPQTIWNLPIL